MIGDENDSFARGVQGICAVFLALASVGGLYMVLHSTLTMIMLGGVAVTLGSLRLCYRYALTGRGNVNRDDF